ncbi:deoxyribose-phosphate aldolase [Dyadobacter tibetensis]|uniref:deoxyribose-phosphate aldolase n=1 Tax=Dyadobacter tibetensis TaxID=1211851 RepID=UPI00046FE8E1|nr:deoxyribose-phosphate aldolase [Dyadobacter tibetensis]
MHPLAPFIDHSLLTPTASETQIRKLCEEAWIYQTKAICVAPSYVAYVTDMMEHCPVPIETATVIGFPNGYHLPEVKLLEAQRALEEGATELDVVMNISRFKSMAYISVANELSSIIELAHGRDALVKVIIETAYLDTFELHTACEICRDIRTDFVKTSTGFASVGVQVETVAMMRQLLPPEIQIKASGGIKTKAQAQAFLEAGATRIGTSSTALILNEI